MHIPVLLQETVDLLCPSTGEFVFDGTLGCGSHASELMKAVLPDGFLIGVDADINAVNIASKRMSIYNADRYKLINDNFKNIGDILSRLKINEVDIILADLGVSSIQLDTAVRGFSIKADGPLDMRMDCNAELTAYTVVNKYTEEELADIIYNFGEERFSRKIARFIVAERKKNPLETTGNLSEIIRKAVGRKYSKLKIHPATRTFQAIRIEVNKELDALKEFLKHIPRVLKTGGRCCIISFHSLEDRIVKNEFKRYASAGIAKIITKKPVTAGSEEIRVNARARSAKMRVIEKLKI